MYHPLCFQAPAPAMPMLNDSIAHQQRRSGSSSSCCTHDARTKPLIASSGIHPTTRVSALAAHDACGSAIADVLCTSVCSYIVCRTVDADYATIVVWSAKIPTRRIVEIVIIYARMGHSATARRSWQTCHHQHLRVGQQCRTVRRRQQARFQLP